MTWAITILCHHLNKVIKFIIIFCLIEIYVCSLSSMSPQLPLFFWKTLILFFSKCKTEQSLNKLTFNIQSWTEGMMMSSSSVLIFIIYQTTNHLRSRKVIQLFSDLGVMYYRFIEHCILVMYSIWAQFIYKRNEWGLHLLNV